MEQSKKSLKVTLPKRLEYLTEHVAKIRDARLNLNMERIVETFAMVISKVKLDLMDNRFGDSKPVFFRSNSYLIERKLLSHNFGVKMIEIPKEQHRPDAQS